MLSKKLLKHHFYIEYKTSPDKPFLITTIRNDQIIYGTGIRLKSYEPIQKEIEAGNLENPSMYKMKKSNIKIKNKTMSYWFISVERKNKEEREPFIQSLLKIANKYKEHLFDETFFKVKKTEISDTNLPEYIKELKKYEENIYASIQMISKDDYLISVVYSKDLLAWRILIRNEDLINPLKSKINLIKNNYHYIITPIKQKETLENFEKRVDNIIKSTLQKVSNS